MSNISQRLDLLRPKLSAGSMLAVFCTVFLSTIGPILSDTSQPGEGTGSTLRQAVYAVVLILALASNRVIAHPVRLNALPAPIVVLLLWCGLSLAWAVDPAVGLRRLVLTALIIYAIFLAVDRAGYARSIQATRTALVFVLLANYVAVFFWPEWGIHQNIDGGDPSIVGAWRGVLMQKNFAGAACALTILFYIFDAHALRLPMRVFVVSAASVFLWFSESKTSMGFLALSAVVGAIAHFYSPRQRRYVLVLMALALASTVVLAYQYWDVLMTPFAAEDALTGRVQIWPVLWRYAVDHVWTGSGFGSFWNISKASPVSEYSDGWVSQIVSGHNGYLDLLVQIGLPGLVLALYAFGWAPMKALSARCEMAAGTRSLLAALIVFCLGHNLTESSLMDRDVMVHVFLVLSIALLGVQSKLSHQC